MTALPETRMPSTRLGIWIAAIRPATLWAGAVPVLVGAAFAESLGYRPGLPAFAALIGAILIQIGTNLVNDYADFKTGADGPDRLGPARAAAQGWLSASSIKRGAKIALTAAGCIGAYITYVGGWPMLVLGLISIFFAWGYTSGPFPLAYLGLGDLFVLLFFGWAAVGGTFFLETATLTDAIWLSGFAVGALATAILVVNNLRDHAGDARVGKKTLVVRFGTRFGRIEYVLLVLGAYGTIVFGIETARLPPGAWLVMASLPLGLIQMRGVWTRRGAELNQHLGGTAQLELIFGLSLALGVVVWP